MENTRLNLASQQPRASAMRVAPPSIVVTPATRWVPGTVLLLPLAAMAIRYSLGYSVPGEGFLFTGWLALWGGSVIRGERRQFTLFLKLLAQLSPFGKK